MLDLKKALQNILTTLTTLPGLTNSSIKVVHNVRLTSSGEISAGGNCAIKSTNVSSYIPSGYKLVWATLRGTQSTNAVCWYFEWTEATKTVEYRLRNVGSSTLTTSPTANLFLVKVGGVARRLLTKLISERRWATC